MEKIKKVLNLIVMIMFLFQNPAFCISEENFALRPPSHFNQATEQFIRHEELVNIPLDRREEQFALSDGNISYQDFIAIMRDGAGQLYNPQTYAIADIGTLLGNAQARKSLLKEDNKPLMALYALLSKAITLAAPNPRVFYIGLGVGTRNSIFDIHFPLLTADFKELIGVEKQWIGFDKFKELVIQELDGLVRPENIQFNESKESNEKDSGIYEAHFTVFGKERMVRGYFGEKYKLPGFVPNEVKAGYNVLIDRTASSSDDLKIQLLELLDKKAGFVLDWSLHEPKPGPHGRLIAMQQTGYDFGDFTDNSLIGNSYGVPQLARLLSEDLYIHNIACLKLKQIYHMLHLLAFPETVTQLKKSKSEANLSTRTLLSTLDIGHTRAEDTSL